MDAEGFDHVTTEEIKGFMVGRQETNQVTNTRSCFYTQMAD